MVLSSTVRSAAQNLPTFRAGISLVHVEAQMVGENGRPISGLNRSDFRVFDEGQEQPIAIFSGYDQPLDLILLIDISGSMRHKVEEIAGRAGRP